MFRVEKDGPESTREQQPPIIGTTMSAEPTHPGLIQAIIASNKDIIILINRYLMEAMKQLKHAREN